MSQLEREVELEMDENDGDSLGREFANLEATDDDDEIDSDDDTRTELAARFTELSSRSFESEPAVDEGLSELLGEMEREYFFGNLKKKLKKAGMGLLKKGLKLAKGLPGGQAIQAITQLARGDLKGLLGALAKAGISAAAASVPGGAVALPALQALGFEATEEPEENQEAWQRFVDVSREAFDHLARNLHESADDPVEAAQLAAEAYQAGLQRVVGSAKGRRNGAGTRRIRLRPGETLTIQSA